MGPSMEFNLVVLVVSIISGAVASVVGFGIGSLLTPLLAVQVGTKIAVASVSIPHFLGTAYRCWGLRQHIDRLLLIRFGFMSALGGFVGAALNTCASNTSITLVFGALLIFVGVTGVFGWDSRIRLGKKRLWFAGALSGMFGGLVGNQGGIRSAALLSFDLSKEAFVATATAIGVIVDLARVPVYLFTEMNEIQQNLPAIGIASLGVMVGTVLGMQYLKNLPEQFFRKTVSAAVLSLGVSAIYKCLS